MPYCLKRKRVRRQHVHVQDETQPERIAANYLDTLLSSINGLHPMGWLYRERDEALVREMMDFAINTLELKIKLRRGEIE